MESSFLPRIAAVVLIVVLALFMVHAMVQWSRVRIHAPIRSASPRSARRRTPPSPAAGTRTSRWGWIYLGSWLALAGAFLLLLRVTGAGWTIRNLTWLAAIAAAYLVVNLALIAFTRALIRAGDGAASGPTTGPAAATAAPIPSTPATAAGAGRSPNDRGAATGPSALSAWLSGLPSAAWVIGVVVFSGIVGALPHADSVEAWFGAQRPLLLPPLAAAAGLGWALLIAMAIGLVLARGGARRNKSATIARIKVAWRSGTWHTRRWRYVFVGLAGTLLMTVGLLGVAVVLAPVGIKALCAAALIYALVRTAIAFARA